MQRKQSELSQRARAVDLIMSWVGQRCRVPCSACAGLGLELDPLFKRGKARRSVSGADGGIVIGTWVFNSTRSMLSRATPD